MQGHKQNLPPIEKYTPEVRAFIERSAFVLKESARMTGLVQDAGGRCHSILALPKGLSVGNSLDLVGTKITALPEGLRVGGGLFLSGTKVTELPERLNVGGDLDLEGTAIMALPEGLIGGSVFLPNGTECGDVTLAREKLEKRAGRETGFRQIVAHCAAVVGAALGAKRRSRFVANGENYLTMAEQCT